jgi:hypothetical protein
VNTVIEGERGLRREPNQTHPPSVANVSHHETFTTLGQCVMAPHAPLTATASRPESTLSAVGVAVSLQEVPSTLLEHVRDGSRARGHARDELS